MPKRTHDSNASNDGSLDTDLCSPTESVSKRRREDCHQICHWEHCGEIFPTSAAMFSHIQDSHLTTQTAKECRWLHCRRFGREMASDYEMIQHILTHVPGKAFKCIIMGCDAVFSTGRQLQAHVEKHIKSMKLGPSKLKCGDPKKPKPSPPPPNTRYVYNRLDFFDPGSLRKIKLLNENFLDPSRTTLPVMSTHSRDNTIVRYLVNCAFQKDQLTWYDADANK